MLTKIFSGILAAVLIAATLAFVAMSGHVLYMDFLDLPTWEIQEEMRRYVFYFVALLVVFPVAVIAGAIGAIAGKLMERYQPKIARGARKVER